MKKKCKYCGQEFDALHGKAYCSPECHNQKVIANHTFVCKTCGASFYSKYLKNRKYCSRECEYESMRTSERVHECIACGEIFIRPKRNGDSCKFCSRECAFEYKESKKSRRASRIRRCKTCERIFFISGHDMKYCSDKCRLVAYKNGPNYNSQEIRRGRYVPKKKECKNCGKDFLPEFKGEKSFCSAECRARYARELKRKRKHRLDGLVIDKDITLTKLSIRDEGVCKLCGDLVDWNDYKINSAGAWVAGARYPSIDHIYPISLGGKHAWDNIQLAHCRCNSLKGASVG